MEKLKNGAYVIARKPMLGCAPHCIVLAKTEGPQPFVTWEEYRHPGEEPSTGSGHYFSDIVKAAQDFDRR